MRERILGRIVKRWPERFIGRFVSVTMRDGTVHSGRLVEVRRDRDGRKLMRIV